jgi:hypothetical protein
MRLPEILEKRFEEYKKDIPDFIEQSEDYYGSYKMRPVIFISFDYYYDGVSREEFRKIQNVMMDANTEFRKILLGYYIKDLTNERGCETFVIYATDKEDNKDWLEKNKDCGYVTYMNKNSENSYTGSMPLAINTNKSLKEYWEKYPFTKIKNYNK